MYSPSEMQRTRHNRTYIAWGLTASRELLDLLQEKVRFVSRLNSDYLQGKVGEKYWIPIAPLPLSTPRIFYFRGLKMKPLCTSKIILHSSTESIAHISSYSSLLLFQLYGQLKLIIYSI